MKCAVQGQFLIPDEILLSRQLIQSMSSLITI